MSFVHLHVHSHYSLLDGLSKVDELVSAAKEMNMPALALTDHGVMYGVMDFYAACKDAGIKPIIGVEGYLARNKHTDKRPNIDNRPYHLTLLAKNLTGYQNLVKLTSTAHIDGYYYKPRFDLDLLKEHREGLVVLSGCLNGPISRAIIDDDSKKVAELLDYFQAVFEDDFYLEIQDRPTIPEQAKVNAQFKTISKERGIKLVATNDSHYTRADDAEAQDVQMCIHMKKKVSEKDRMSYIGEDVSLAPENVMRKKFTDQPEACDVTMEIADKCNVEFEFGKYHLPHYETPNDISAEEYLKQLCIEGLKRRFGIDYKNPSADDHETMERLEYELSIIQKTGFSSYFLIVSDFVNWSKDNGIIVGPGRGSAAGSLVSYLINITNIDPLKYDLLFERFLNPERISMPDIDLDFADSRRDEVLEYVAEKYGRNNVAQIITFGTMAARAAVRDVGRVLGLSYGFCDRIAKLIPMFTKLGDAIETVPELKEYYNDDPEAKQLLDLALKLEGCARHTSTHACGVVITPKELTEYMPIQHASTDDDSIVTQFSWQIVESLGLLKMDFLGLKNLTIIENTIYIAEKTAGAEIDIEKIPLDDKKTFALLQKAETTGVFQLESSGMKRYLKQLKPSEFEDIIAMVSLYRPGPMDFIPDYIDGKHGRKKPTYLHEKLRPIMERTYGIAVYQEQIMQIARDLGGFSYGEADVLRKAVGKKIKKLLDEQEEKMISGMVGNGIEKSTAQKIWDFILPFARYGFNRSHGACYAMIAYQTAYLKANYPAQFMAALLTADQGNTDRIAVEVAECQRVGIEVLPPDVNESFSTFTVVKESIEAEQPRIRFGMQAIKNVGHNIVRAIIDERKKSGPYKNLEDFLTRVQSKDLNKKSIEALTMSGAMDAFGERNSILSNMETILSYAKRAQTDRANGQTNLFGMLPEEQTPKLVLEQVEAATSSAKLGWEKQLLGLYISDHPFREVQDTIKDFTTTLQEVRVHKERTPLATGGVITSVKKIITKSGEPMAFARLEDSTAEIELLVFPRMYQEHGHLWQPDRMVVVSGKLSDKDDEPKMLVDAVAELDPEHPEVAKNEIQLASAASDNRASGYLNIKIPPGTPKDALFKMKKIFEENPGNYRVFLRMRDEKVATNALCDYNETIHNAVEELCGRGTIQLIEKTNGKDQKNYRQKNNFA